MKNLSKGLVTLLVAMALSFTSLVVKADKPFANTKIVLQISDADPSKQTLVLNVANNIIKHYGQDDVDIEVVAFGPGLRLMFADNENKGRIDSLTNAGVRFDACSNTVKGMTKLLGHPPVLNAKATVVPAGVVQIIDLTKKGYVLIKP